MRGPFAVCLIFIAHYVMNNKDRPETRELILIAHSVWSRKSGEVHSIHSEGARAPNVFCKYREDNGLPTAATARTAPNRPDDRRDRASGARRGMEDRRPQTKQALRKRVLHSLSGRTSSLPPPIVLRDATSKSCPSEDGIGVV